MDDENWNGVPLAAIGSGLVDVPERLTFADAMGPNERAAYTMRRKYGTQVPTPPELATPAEQGEAALMLASSFPATRAIAAAPRVATALGALGAYLYGTDETNADEKPKTPKEIMAEQKTLQGRGIYKGAIDGKEGPDTIAARAEAKRQDAAAAAAERAAELEKLKLQNSESNNATENARIDLEQRRIRERAEGNARMENIDKEVSPFRKAYRDYAGPAGYLGGAIAGTALRGALVKAADKLAAYRAARAEGLFDEAAKAGKAGYPTRVSRVNEFWRQGGGGGREPFLNTPGNAPGFAVNPNAAPASSLYQPPTLWNTVTDLGALGMFGAESAYAQKVMGHEAEEELGNARAAVKDDASDANIRRLQAAIDKQAWAQFLTNFGRGGFLSYGGKTALKFREQSPPNMANAEAEKLALEELLRRPPRAPRTRTNVEVPNIAPGTTPTRTRITPRSRANGKDEGESLADILNFDPLGR